MKHAPKNYDTTVARIAGNILSGKNDRDRLRALEPYLQHKRACIVNMEVSGGLLAKNGGTLVLPDCTCGLLELRAALLTVEAPRPQEVDVHELARDIDFAIDVTEPRAVLLARFEDVIRQHLNGNYAVNKPTVQR